MIDNVVVVSAQEGVTIEEATQKALKDIFKSFPSFDGTKGFKYYEYDWNFQKFKDLDGNDHPENLKMTFPVATFGSYFGDTQAMMTYHVDKKFLDNGLFPVIERFFTDMVDISMYYEDFKRKSNILESRDYRSGAYDFIFSSKVPFLIYIGQYNNLHYFAILHTGYPSTFIWLFSFNPNTGTLSHLGNSSLISGSWQPQSKVYTYFNSANNTFELFLLAWRVQSSSLHLMKATIDLSFVEQYNHIWVSSLTTVPLPSPLYLTNNINHFVFNDRSRWSMVNTSPSSRFLYFFDDPVKEISTNTINDVLLLSFWDSVYNPTEVKLVLVPFLLNTSNNTISYYTHVEKKYNPFQLTPKIYKYNFEGEERIYLTNINNNYEYSVDGVVSRVDNFTLILQDLDEQNFNFNVVGYKNITVEEDDLGNYHGVITFDECKTSDVCVTISSLYHGVGAFSGYYPVTKKNDRFLFVYISSVYNHYPEIYEGSIVPRTYGSYAFATLVYDMQFPLTSSYTPPTSETDIPKIAKNPWFVELHHPGIEKWEFLTKDSTNKPVYKNSKKVYLWSNVLVNYPKYKEFSITVESLFRGDGVLYPNDFLFANNILKDFDRHRYGSALHSPFATGSFYSFFIAKLVDRENLLFDYSLLSKESLSSSNKRLLLKYAYSPDLSSFYLGAIQGNKSFPIAIFSIIDDRKPRIYKWFNIYGNITFFDAKVAFAPSRGFFTGSYMLPKDVFTEAKVSNFYPCFSLDFPKVFSLYSIDVERPVENYFNPDIFEDYPKISSSSYFYERGVKVLTIPSRRDLLEARSAFSFYFFPNIVVKYELREFDSTGNFYFNLLNTQNVLFIPDSSYFKVFSTFEGVYYDGENLKVGDSVSMRFGDEIRNYEVVDVVTFENIDILNSRDDLNLKMYLVLRKE
jgi:hypothetical protein